MDDLLIRFQGSAEETDTQEANPTKAEDLHLVCVVDPVVKTSKVPCLR